MQPLTLRSPVLLTLSLLLLPVGTVSCGGVGARQGSGGTPSAENVLRLPMPEEPTRWDPASVQDGPTIELLMHVVEGLVQWSPDNQVVPALAELPEITNGGRTYTFKLKGGVRFHNGRALTAADFVYSINRALNPSTQSEVAATYLNDIVGAREVLDGKSMAATGLKAPDERTLVIEIDRPKPYFLAKLTYPTAYVVAREGVEQGRGQVTEPAHLIGTGPFTVAEYLRGHSITLAANPTYHEGRPKLERITRRIVRSAETRRQMFDNDELDLVDVPMSDYERDRNEAELQPLIHQFDRPSVYYFAFNERFGPFRDRRVRRAFAMAINRDRIVKEVLLGLPIRAEGILPKGVPGYDPAFKGVPFDPSQAKRLLAEAGFPDGAGFPALTLSFREGLPDIRRVCEVAEQDLREHLGVTVRLQQMDYGELLRQRNQSSLPFYFLRWMADYLDPQDFLSVMLRTGAPENRIRYSNREFDRLCDEGDAHPDHERRLALYRQAERIAVDDAAWAPVYFQKDIELWKPRVQGIRDSLMGHLPHKTTTVR